MLWVDKYKPSLEEVPQDIKQIVDFVTNYAKQKKKALLIHGPPGTGKTVVVHALAKKDNLELIEVNASDFRTDDQINSRIGNALKQQSLFSQSKLILVDELDGISGRKDRGGVKALSDLLKKSKFPVILVANDPWNKKFNTLRTKSKLIEFPAIIMTAMLPVLKRIIEKEGITVDDSILKTLARRSGGDIRGAITDLQILAQASELTVEGLNSLNEREKSESIMQALVKILKSTDPKVAIDALENVGEDFDQSILWIDENLPLEYTKPEDLARAYEALSKADIYKARIRRWQYWRYLVYVKALITAGVAVAKDQKSSNFVAYKRTQRILKLWMANQKYARRKRVAEKLAAATHSSIKKVMLHTLPHIQIIYKQKHPSAAAITEELDLDEEELEWLNK